MRGEKIVADEASEVFQLV